MSQSSRADYLALGHPTLDVTALGDYALGGTVLYSGLQAARLQQRTVILGRANAAAIAPRWSPYEGEAELVLQDSSSTTVFSNVEDGEGRKQSIVDWAGPMVLPDRLPAAAVLHLAPVAREFELADALDRASADFIGLTAQGLLRRFDTSVVGHEPYRVPAAVAGRLDVVVVADYEAGYADDLLRGAVAGKGLAVITRGRRGCQVMTASGVEDHPAPAGPEPVADSTGAGDIFAAALFVELYRGAGLADAIRLAGTAAALSLDGFGLDAVRMRGPILARVPRAA
jgi:1D-myo-inositol 3-kinase